MYNPLTPSQYTIPRTLVSQTLVSPDGEQIGSFADVT